MKIDNLVIGYLQLRKMIGFLGLALPLILIISNYILSKCNVVQMSISQYYYTSAGDLFVGTMAAISIFLFAYKGYNATDSMAGNIAAVFGLATAIFPTNGKVPLPACNFEISPYPFPDYFKQVHTASAVLFFLVLAYFSLFLFTKTNGEITPEKRLRNRVYRICGFVIIACLVVLAILFFVDSMMTKIAIYKPIFVLETIILWAFGISWLVKGEFILADSEK